jgi:surface antigen
MTSPLAKHLVQRASWPRAIAVLAAAAAVAGCALLDPPAAPADTAFVVASQRALEYLPDRESLHWVDPETEEASQVTVLQTLTDADGRFCRLLLIESSVRPGAPIERFCREPDSDSWRFVRRLTAAEAAQALAAGQPQASR